MAKNKNLAKPAPDTQPGNSLSELSDVSVLEINTTLEAENLKLHRKIVQLETKMLSKDNEVEALKQEIRRVTNAEVNETFDALGSEGVRATMIQVCLSYFQEHPDEKKKLLAQLGD